MVISFLALAAGCFGQTAGGQQEAGKVMVTEVSFRLVGGGDPLILVPTYVNGQGPYEFILDTGAVISLLTPELARSLGIQATESKEARGAGGAVKVSLARVESLAVGRAKIDDMRIGITGELQRIGAAVRAKIDGDIGYDFLKSFAVTVDYQRSVLRLTQGEQDQGGTGDAARSEVRFKPASPAKPLVLVAVSVNGQGPYQFALDTGASATVLSAELAQSLGLKTVEAPAITGGGGRVKTSIGTVESLAVGSTMRRNLSVVVADFLTMLSQVTGAKIDGIVGYNFLKNFSVTIDYPQEVLRLE
jgi:predicted aspartyl protease